MDNLELEGEIEYLEFCDDKKGSYIINYIISNSLLCW